MDHYIPKRKPDFLLPDSDALVTVKVENVYSTFEVAKNTIAGWQQNDHWVCMAKTSNDHQLVVACEGEFQKDLTEIILRSFYTMGVPVIAAV